MSYAVYKLDEAGQWANVMDSTEEWVDMDELLNLARVDAALTGPGLYAVEQTSAGDVERHEFTLTEEEVEEINTKAETWPSCAISEAKRLLADAVEALGPDCHEAYAGACREDRNAAVCAIQDGQDPDTVAASYFG